VANILQMSNLARYYFPQYAFGVAGQFVRGDHALVSGQESPRTAHRGHTISLNGSRYHHPVLYFLYHKHAEDIHGDGGLFGYAHVLVDAFHASWGLALDVPMGLVDFVEVLQFSQLGTGLLYDFLNMGFKLNPIAGSDFPYINLPGTERSYVKVIGRFTPQAWFEGLKNGRTFVTTAPVLYFSVAGKTMGEELSVAAGESIEINGSARINPDYDQLTRLELVRHGDVLASEHSDNGVESLALQHWLTVNEGSWLALRAYGKNGSVAHSAPVYVLVNGSDDFSEHTQLKALVEKYKAKIYQLTGSMPLIFEDLEKWDTGHLMIPAWQKQLPALKKRAAVVLKRYDEILENALASP